MTELLAPLIAVLESELRPGIDVYHAADRGQVMIRCELWTVTSALITRLSAAAKTARIAVLETALLAGEQRKRFQREILPEYTLRFTGLPTLLEALHALDGYLQGGRGGAGRSPLEVRFRRGDSWQLGRARDLTTDGVYVATGCPPGPGEVISLELEAAGVRVAAHAVVVHVTQQAGGAEGFAACFVIADGTERTALDRVITSARSTRPVPTPRRREARYPVRWPVFGWLGGGWLTMSALDMSRRGLFVSSGVALPTAQPIALTVPLDEGSPLRASARVARVVSETMAEQRGLASGFGLELTNVADGEVAGFLGFVERVAARAACRVTVVAAPARVATIAQELAGIGYAVAGATAAAALATRLGGGKPSDLVLVDPTFAAHHAAAARTLTMTVALHGLLMLELDADEPLAVIRRRVDEVLLVT